MAKPFLRSGQRSDYLALGENGQIVFDSALPIREALRLRGLGAVANCLAIPQRHNHDDYLDWYAPHEGMLTPWSAISTPLRLQALDYLQQRRAELEAARVCYNQSENLTLRLFSSLLKHVLQFPGVQYMWLLDGKPIIAFWGFSPSAQSSNVQILDTLYGEEKAQLAALMPPEVKIEADIADIKVNYAKTVSEAYEPEHITPAHEPGIAAPMIEAPQSQQPLVNVTEATAPKVRVSLAKKIQYFSLAALFIAGSAAITLPLFYAPSPEVSVIARPTATAPTLAPERERIPQPKFASTLPLQTASVMVVPEIPEVMSEVVPEVVQPVIEPEKNTLVLFPDSIKAGSVKFLNGHWKAQFLDTAKDTDTRPALILQIANGKGEMRLTQKNKVCRAALQAGLLPSGTLSIKSRSRARCRDGSRQAVPDITCQSGPNAVARCLAQWANNESAQLTFKKIDG